MLKLWNVASAALWVSIGLIAVRCSDAPPSESNPGFTETRVVPPGIVAPDAQWEPIGEGLVYVDGIAARSDGTAYFGDAYLNRLYQIGPDNVVSLLEESTQMTMGLTFGPDGLLYACRNHAAQIVRYNADGAIEVLLEGELSPVPDEEKNPGEFCNDLAINAAGGIWFTDRVNERVRYLAPDGSVSDVAEGFRPNGIALSLDRKILVVTDSNNPVLHAFSIGDNGQLTELPDYFDIVRLPKPLPDGTLVGKGKPGSNRIAVDTEGRFYLSSLYGIQIFDRDGNYLGVLEYPQGLFFLSGLGFGGPDYQWLFATGRGGVFRMRTLTQGARW